MTRFPLRRLWISAIAAVALVGSAALATPAVAAPKVDPPPLVAGADRPADPVSHDPTLVKEGEWFYLASTGDLATGRDYIPMKRSKDLRTWEDLPPVFTQLPAGVLAAPSGPGHADGWDAGHGAERGASGGAVQWVLLGVVPRLGG